MKKLAAFVLALVMVLSFCTVALAKDVSTVAYTYKQLGIDDLKNLTGEYTDFVVSIVDNAQYDLMKKINGATIFCYDADGKMILFYLCAGKQWYDGDGSVDIDEFDLTQVAKIALQVNIGSPATTNGWFTSPTVTANGVSLKSAGNVGPLDSYYELYDGHVLNISISYDVAQGNDFNLFSLIGTYWTAKWIGGMVKEAATMPYLAPIVKLAVPTAVIAVIGHMLCHMGAPK